MASTVSVRLAQVPERAVWAVANCRNPSLERKHRITLSLQGEKWDPVVLYSGLVGTMHENSDVRRILVEVSNALPCAEHV